MGKHSKRNIPSLILPSFKSLASAVGQKTQQRPAGIASFFHNQKWKTNKDTKYIAHRTETLLGNVQFIVWEIFKEEIKSGNK